MKARVLAGHRVPPARVFRQLVEHEVAPLAVRVTRARRCLQNRRGR